MTAYYTLMTDKTSLLTYLLENYLSIHELSSSAVLKLNMAGKQIHHHNRAFKNLINRWSRFCDLKPEHIRWAKQNLQAIRTRKGQFLFEEERPKMTLFIVDQGAIINVVNNSLGKPTILNLAVPQMALSTTAHLHSNKPIAGSIQVIRPGQVLCLPYKDLKKWINQDQNINTLVSILFNKQIRFLYLLNQVRGQHTPLERYQHFHRLLPEIASFLNQHQQAQMLGISRSTLQKIKRRELFNR